ncbi:magnesium transporter CorA family protein [Candidatus Peregrinibacteria bacterium]|nr:magnesium transporter CorA family protein [Candidatus Peregrinibacteria bacterium]
MASVISGNNQWVNISKPREEDILELKKKYRFHKLDLEDCLSESQRPKIDEYENYLFIILHFPYYSRRTRHIATEQVNVFIGQNYLITLHDGHLEELDTIFKKCKKSSKARQTFFGESTGFLLYSLINNLFSSSFSITDKIQLKLKQIEEAIFETAHVKDQLFDIMVTKKNIITLRKILLPQRTVIAALEHKQKRFLPENLEIYFDDVVDQIERLWNILETEKEVIESLEDTNESLLSHKINNTMRTLTVFSVIMLPLTFLTGLFGMNVQLPFAEALEHIEHFWSIILAMGVIVVLMVGVFKLNKWL